MNSQNIGIDGQYLTSDWFIWTSLIALIVLFNLTKNEIKPFYVIQFRRRKNCANKNYKARFF